MDFATHNVRDRVVCMLSQLAETYGERNQKGLLLNFRITHEDLGALVGVSRVMVTNVLHKLQDAGHIVLDDHHRFIVSRNCRSRPPAEVFMPEAIRAPACPCFKNAIEDSIGHWG